MNETELELTAEEQIKKINEAIEFKQLMIANNKRQNMGYETDIVGLKLIIESIEKKHPVLKQDLEF